MIDENFKALILDTCKSGSDIEDQIDARKAHLLHMSLGVAGEAGELVDAIKKHVIYNKPLDVDNARDELGDSMYFVTGLMPQLDMSEAEIKQGCIDKLRKRYPAGYSDADAQARADKL